MSNYPNMSYCQCENTLLALRQVISNMQEQGPDFLQEMGREERIAFRELFYACEDFLNLSEELEHEAEREYDGQPSEQDEWHDFDPDC